MRNLSRTVLVDLRADGVKHEIPDDSCTIDGCAHEIVFAFCIDFTRRNVPRHSLRVANGDLVDYDVRELDKFIEIVYPTRVYDGGSDAPVSRVDVDVLLYPRVWIGDDDVEAFELKVHGLAIDGYPQVDPVLPVIHEARLVRPGEYLEMAVRTVSFSVVAHASYDYVKGEQKILKGTSFVVDPVIIIAPKRP